MGNNRERALFFVIIATIIGISFGINYKGCKEITQGAPQQTFEEFVQGIERMDWSSPLGKCDYTGPVDDLRFPHGYGEAYFEDGRYYKGDFKHGVFSGDNCYFQYANGDVFKGKFRNNAFYYGRYTIAKDKSYYEGYYEKGQPSGGTWYDKNGNVIQ